MNSRELRAKRASLWEQAKAVVDRAEAEDRGLSAEEKQQFDALDGEMVTLDQRIDTQEHLETTRHDDVPAEDRVHGGPSAAAARLIQTGATSQDLANEADRKRIWDRYLRFGKSEMDPTDLATLRTWYRTESGPIYQNAQGTTSGAAGGYTIRPAWRDGLVEAMKAYGGMRQVAEIITTDSGADLPFMTVDDTSNVGTLVAENQAVTEQDVSFGVRVLKAFMYTSYYVPVSYQILQDTAIDLEGYLTRAFATRIGRITNTHFTSGAGANMPSGIENDATLGVTAAATGAVTSDELIDLEHSVDPAYRGMPGVRYMFNDTTLRELKQLKDGNGNYLWLPGVTSGEPSTLLGYQYVINQDVASMATTNKSIFFGDLSAYKIRDVRDVFVLRLEELHALSGQVTFLAFSRHDGGLIDAGQHPVKYIQQA